MERVRPYTWPQGVEESVLRQKKVISTIPVQAEYRRTTHRREGDSLINSIYSETGCIVVAYWDQHTIKRLDVFAGAGSKAAVASVNKWIARGSEKSKDASAWSKTPAFNHAQWYQEQLEQREEERKEFFLGPVPDEQEGGPSPQKLVVDWPKDLLEYGIDPRKAFGSELQGLNDIRKQDEVFITLLPDHRVEIVGLEASSIDAAQDHYRTLVAKLKAGNCSLRQATHIVMDEREGLEVVLIEAEAWWPDLTDMVVPHLRSSEMMFRPGSFREDDLYDAQLKTIRDAFKRALEAVSYNKGSYDFAVRLGCIALSSKQTGPDYLGREHPKELFVKSINTKVDVSPKKWLLNHVLGIQLYHRLIARDDFLEPIKAAGYWGSMSTSLKDSRPSLRGTWVFKDPNVKKLPVPPIRNVGRPIPMQQVPLQDVSYNAESFLYMVQIDWTDDGEGTYDKTEVRFYRLDHGKNGPRANMEINLLELGESRAWSFALESMTPVSRSVVPPVLTGFAQRTVLNKSWTVDSETSFAICDSSPSVKNILLHDRVDKVYSFGVRNTCYKVELTAMWYRRCSPPCWGLAVRHTEWATHLAELERLQSGHQATWGGIIETFLPEGGGSSSKFQDNDLGVSDLKLSDEMEKTSVPPPPQDPSVEGVRTLTNILLQLSEIVSSVTMSGGIQI